MSEDGKGATSAPDGNSTRPLSPVAQRALAEADARRRAAEAASSQHAKELGGRGGADPVRYGDWEVKGLATDF